MKNRILFSIALASAAFTTSQAEDLKPLTLEFPPPFLIGTPVPVQLPHLEAPDAKAPSIMVPADVANIAFEKEVTSSDDFPIIGELEFLTDGDKESEEGYFVELAPGLQWAQIDLGAKSELYALAIWHFHAQKRAYHDVIIQVSDDPEFKTGITTLFNNDHDNSAGMGKGKDKAYIESNKGKLISLGKAKAQHLRLYSYGNTSNEMNHYVEVEVFGR